MVADCQTAAGLTILQPSSGSLTATGDLTLYCPGTGTDGRNGETGQGTPAQVRTGTCTVDTGWEEAQLIGHPTEITPAGGAGRMEAFPIAFWSGTTGGEFATDTDTFYSGSDSDDRPRRQLGHAALALPSGTPGLPDRQGARQRALRLLRDR